MSCRQATAYEWQKKFENEAQECARRGARLAILEKGVDAIATYYQYPLSSYNDTYKQKLQFITDLIMADEWVSVKKYGYPTEGHTEWNQEYVVSYSNGEWDFVRVSKKVRREQFEHEVLNEDGSKCVWATAWKPLSEPYKED